MLNVICRHCSEVIVQRSKEKVPSSYPVIGKYKLPCSYVIQFNHLVTFYSVPIYVCQQFTQRVPFVPWGQTYISMLYSIHTTPPPFSLMVRPACDVCIPRPASQVLVQPEHTRRGTTNHTPHSVFSPNTATPANYNTHGMFVLQIPHTHRYTALCLRCIMSS